MNLDFQTFLWTSRCPQNGPNSINQILSIEAVGRLDDYLTDSIENRISTLPDTLRATCNEEANIQNSNGTIGRDTQYMKDLRLQYIQHMKNQINQSESQNRKFNYKYN